MTTKMNMNYWSDLRAIDQDRKIDPPDMDIDAPLTEIEKLENYDDSEDRANQVDDDLAKAVADSLAEMLADIGALK